MLFSNKIPAKCAYCQKGNTLADGNVFCLKYGVMSPEGKCHKFRYDPLKRTPPPPAMPNFKKLKDADFSL